MGFKDFMFGKTIGPSQGDLDILDDTRKLQKDLVNAQRLGLREINAQKKEAPSSAAFQIAREQRYARSGAEDQLRALRTRMAQMGLQRSSVGLGQESAIQGQMAENIQSIGASLPERIRQMRLSLAQMQLTGGQSGMAGAFGAAPLDLTPVRKPGFITPYLTLAGAGLGAASGGGAQGAAGGAQIGRGTGQSLEGLFGG